MCCFAQVLLQQDQIIDNPLQPLEIQTEEAVTDENNDVMFY